MRPADFIGQLCRPAKPPPKRAAENEKFFVVRPGIVPGTSLAPFCFSATPCAPPQNPSLRRTIPFFSSGSTFSPLFYPFLQLLQPSVYTLPRLIPTAFPGVTPSLLLLWDLLWEFTLTQCGNLRKKQLPKKETYAIMENCDMQNTNFSLLFCDGKGRRPEGGARNYESV